MVVAKAERTGERGYYFMGTELQFFRMADVLEMLVVTVLPQCEYLIPWNHILKFGYDGIID